MNLKRIKYFIDLVECRNFTETAKRILYRKLRLANKLPHLRMSSTFS